MSRVGDLFSDDPASAAGCRRSQNTSIALLLPLSAPGETQNIARALQQAAELAVKDTGGGKLIIKDTGGTADMARTAAEAALNEGAGIILGPLLSTEVQAVSPVARARNVNVIAFSSVSSVAAQGTFLMSFLPDEEVSNVVRYAAGKGYRNISLLYPASQYGAAIEQALSRSALSEGSTIVGGKKLCPRSRRRNPARRQHRRLAFGTGQRPAPAGGRPDAAHRQRRARRKRHQSAQHENSRHRPVG